MHEFHSTTISGLEFGIADRTLGFAAASVSAPSTTTQIATRTTKPVAGERAKSVPVTPTDQAKEAIKDGKISAAEKTAFDKTPVTKEVVKGEEKRLAAAVRKAEGNDHLRDDKGNLRLNDGKPVATATGSGPSYDAYRGVTAIDPDTDHEKSVKELGKGQNADELQVRIDKLKADGTTTGVDDLIKDKADRLAKEGKVVDVVADKTAYIGTLQAEKGELEASGSADAKDDFQKLRNEALVSSDGTPAPLVKFLENDGQVYEPDMFGDDWDNAEATPKHAASQFDKLAKQFHKDPKLLDKWVAHQGDSKDAVKDMDAHIAGIDGSELHDKIAGRYEAAKELRGIFERYNTAKDTTDTRSGRIGEIDAEITVTNKSIQADTKVLSSDSKQALAARLAPVDGIIPPTETTTTEGRSGKTSTSNPSGGTGDPQNADNDPEVSADGAPEVGNADGEETSATPTTREVPVDYTTPERRETVLTQARERELVPADNSSFNDQGQSVYTVQNGDSYWRIADMSDGQPPHAFDTNHFLETLNSNSKRLGRDPQVGLINPDEQVILPNRSIQDLVKLLELPTVETVGVEGE